jgi:hypothetical protein
MFGATTYPTEPSPVPFAPEVSVIHDALLAAVHEQPLADFTLTSPVPPIADTSRLDGEIE